MRGFDKKERRERGSVNREERTFFSVTSEKPKVRKHKTKRVGQNKRNAK